MTPGPAPYFFVVDQRRLGRGQGGGPTRGQIVRVNPFGLAANGYLPIYEDYIAQRQPVPDPVNAARPRRSEPRTT